MSDSDWDESSEEQPNYFSAKQKFEQHIARLHNDYIEKPKTPEVIIPDLPVPVIPSQDPKSKSAAELLDEFWTECSACGQRGLIGSVCSCDDTINEPPTDSPPMQRFDAEFRMWIENKIISNEVQSEKFDNQETGITLVQYIESEPSRMSWQQLAKVIPPQRIVNDESSLLTTDDESDNDSSVARDYEVPDIQECNDDFFKGKAEPLQANDIQELKELLASHEKNLESLIAEREFLIEQLQACEDRIEEIEIEIRDLDVEIERLNQEYNNTVVADELISELDEFSQAVQILLNASEFYDIKDLISAYARDGATNDDIKRQVILDAKLTKKQQLLGSVNTRAVNPKPRNPDGLPNLHDSYLIDSYTL